MQQDLKAARRVYLHCSHQTPGRQERQTLKGHHGGRTAKKDPSENVTKDGFIGNVPKDGSIGKCNKGWIYQECNIGWIHWEMYQNLPCSVALSPAFTNRVRRTLVFCH